MFNYSGKANLPSKLNVGQIMDLDGIRAFSSASALAVSNFSLIYYLSYGIFVDRS